MAVLSHPHAVLMLLHKGAVAESYLLHVRVGAHVMFHRLYGMYPCHFLTFLRSSYGRPENVKIFKDVILVRDPTCLIISNRQCDFLFVDDVWFGL